MRMKIVLQAPALHGSGPVAVAAALQQPLLDHIATGNLHSSGAPVLQRASVPPCICMKPLSRLFKGFGHCKATGGCRLRGVSHSPSCTVSACRS